VNHPNYGILTDIGNFIVVDADILESVALTAPYAFHVHVKDFLYKDGSETRPSGWWTTSGGNFIRGTVAGHGVVPIQQSISILREAGYNGYVSLEFEGWEDNIQAVKAGCEYLKRL
jgi:sugar phosphate isomerase/epimerase